MSNFLNPTIKGIVTEKQDVANFSKWIQKTSDSRQS